MLSITEENYEHNNVTVTVEWAQQVGATYDVKLSPSVPLIVNGSSSYQMTVSYNMEYSLSVVAVTPCINATASITLNYGEAYIMLSIAAFTQ